jgi:hypothetical protein
MDIMVKKLCWGILLVAWGFTQSLWAADAGLETGIEDDLTVSGTNGTKADADLEVKGYTVFGSSGANAQVVTSGVGSVYVDGQAEIESNAFFNASVAIGATNVAGANTRLGVGTNNDFQVNSSGDVVELRGVPYAWPTNQGNPWTVLQNDGAGGLRWGGAMNTVTFHAPATNRFWINHPTNLTEFASTNLYRVMCDLTNATQARLTVVVAIAGRPTARIAAQYSNQAAAAWRYLDNVSGPVVGISTADLRVSGWVVLEPAARADVLLRLVGTNGNGTVDPAFGLITVQFR